MADFLGLTLETVGRMIQRLARSGIIAIRPRRGLTITNAAGLRALAGHIDPL
jgi:Mn-dependent DtxR family transcriptional regulator